MVWASTKLTLWDDIYPTFKTMSIEYRGRHPHILYKKINQLIREIFRVPEGNVQEREYTWNKTENGEEFSVWWEATRQLDDFSYMRIEIKLNGFTSNNVGKATVSFRPTLVSEYPQDTFWQQNIIYEMFRRFWHVVFYRKKRNEWFEMGKIMAERFEKNIKSFVEELK
ncbi:MAG: hypothetical protein J7J38_03675 [Candidatus Aenigmarchaeota archaeon]|nr:hypothetical protein [Candidatus Aenigmarchaeota archaeon]